MPGAGTAGAPRAELGSNGKIILHQEVRRYAKSATMSSVPCTGRRCLPRGGGAADPRRRRAATMTPAAPASPEEVLDFWFEGAVEGVEAITARGRVWFGADPAFDRVCRERFAGLLARAVSGELDGWQETPRGALALVIVLDQLSRNIHRGSRAAFAGDAGALACCLRARERKFDEALRPIERMFLCMPLQHAEDRQRQDESVRTWEALAAGAGRELAGYFENSLGYARKHRDIVHRFGRFPHRNAVLGRDSTPQEQQYLDGGAPRFGQ